MCAKIVFSKRWRMQPTLFKPVVCSSPWKVCVWVCVPSAIGDPGAESDPCLTKRSGGLAGAGLGLSLNCTLYLGQSEWCEPQGPLRDFQFLRISAKSWDVLGRKRRSISSDAKAERRAGNVQMKEWHHLHWKGCNWRGLGHMTTHHSSIKILS